MGILRQYTDYFSGDPIMAAQCVTDIYEYGPNEDHLPLKEAASMGARVVNSLVAAIASVSRMGVDDALRLTKMKRLKGKRYRSRKVLEIRCRQSVRAICFQANIIQREALVIVKVVDPKGGAGKRKMGDDVESILELVDEANEEILRLEGEVR